MGVHILTQSLVYSWKSYRTWDEDVRSLNTIKMKKFSSQDRLKHEKKASAEKMADGGNMEMSVG